MRLELLLAGVAFALVGRYLFVTLRRRRRFAKGARAEKEAERLARSCGYRIVGTQVPGEVVLRVDGVKKTANVRADMLVERGFRRFIAEVKTGRVAPDPTSSATRRQLLEYQLAFEADGLLLFDMEKHRIHEIHFDRPRTSQNRLFQLILALGLLGAGAALEHSFHLIAWVR